MIRSTLTALVLAAMLFAAGAPGCMFFTTRAEGSRLRAEVKSLRDRVDLMKKRERDTLAALQQAKGELVELKGLLPRARAILLRNSARFGAQLDRLIATVSKIQGRLENVETDLGNATKGGKGVRERIAKVAETVERIKIEVTRLMAEVRKKPAAPKTAGELFAAANVARLTGRAAEARQLFAKFVKRYPRNVRVEAAYYLTARTHFDAYDYRAAVVAVAQQLKKYPRGRFSARGRLLSARSYFELKRCKTALRILGRLVRLFPNAEITPEARQLLLRVQRLRKVSRYCQR
jgi:TolA-binding protein